MMSLLILSVTSIFGVHISSAQDSASLTGNIYDSGVDTDGDGTFNYLKVGVKVNVAESGDYKITVYGLRGAGEWQYVYVGDSETAHLDVGVRVINVSLYGPTIYVSGINPVNVSHISLYRINDYDYYLGGLYDVPLSREYCCTEFDSPFADAEVTFIVDPDGRVVMAGALNYTDIPTRYTGPVTQGIIAFSKSDNLTSVSTSCTFTIPPEALAKAPLNSMDFALSSKGSNDVFDTKINCSVVLSEVIASKFPFNITDFTATGQYENNLLTGTVTIHMLPGFALGDVDIDFKGNRTDLLLNGTITVIYGTYYDWELNETSLNEMIQGINSTIPGQGPDSLYNKTYGSLECTTLNITVTPNNTIGATINFKATIRGEFIQALTRVMVPPYYYYPYYYYPPEIFDLVYSALNATYSSIESVSFELAYARVQKKASMRLRIVTNFNKLVEELIPLLQKTAPPEIAQLIQQLLKTRYCSVKSVDLSFSYDDGKGNLEETITVEGDLNAELKNMLLWSYSVAMIRGVPQKLPWQASFINETEIDVSNLIVSFDLTNTSYAYRLGGFSVSPPKDVINATSFKLERFFNLTKPAAGTEFPGERERLKVTIVGGSNSTHTVTISRPETVPQPTSSRDNRIMTWNNQTLSDLKDLIFNIQPETGVTIFDVTNPELISTEKPFIINATETAATLLSITKISKPVTIIVRNATTPPEDVAPPPGTFKVLGNYVEIIASETDITLNATIRIYYTPEQLEAAGLDKDTLKIHYWNGTQWVTVESHVNTTEHYVWAIIDHFSLWALMGQPLPAPIWAQLWFWAVIGVIIVVVVVGTVYVTRKKKPHPPIPPELTKGKSSTKEAAS